MCVCACVHGESVCVCALVHEKDLSERVGRTEGERQKEKGSVCQESTHTKGCTQSLCVYE